MAEERLTRALNAMQLLLKLIDNSPHTCKTVAPERSTATAMPRVLDKWRRRSVALTIMQNFAQPHYHKGQNLARVKKYHSLTSSSLLKGYSLAVRVVI